MTLSITAHYIEWHYAEFQDLFIKMPNVIMLSVVMLNVFMLVVIMLGVVMLNVFMLGVIMMNVVAPLNLQSS